jgi:hypothetical protein
MEPSPRGLGVADLRRTFQVFRPTQVLARNLVRENHVTIASDWRAAISLAGDARTVQNGRREVDHSNHQEFV